MFVFYERKVEVGGLGDAEEDVGGACVELFSGGGDV